jgi:hypothetical protein
MAIIGLLIALATFLLTLSGLIYPKPLIDLKKEFEQFKDTYREKHEKLARDVAHLEGQQSASMSEKK